MRATPGTLPDGMDDAAGSARPTPVRQRSRRAVLLTWLRKTHLYLGLWAAILGLIFGVSGIVLNHRSVLKLPVTLQTTHKARLQLVEPLPANREALIGQLATLLGPDWARITADSVQIRVQPARQVLFAGREQTLPEQWTVLMNRPVDGVTATWVVGNRYVEVEQIEATPLGVLTRMHKGVGFGVVWIVLVDAVGAALIVLSLTGLLLWTQLHPVRTVAVLTSIGALLWGAWGYWAAQFL